MVSVSSVIYSLLITRDPRLDLVSHNRNIRTYGIERQRGNSIETSSSRCNGRSIGGTLIRDRWTFLLTELLRRERRNEGVNDQRMFMGTGIFVVTKIYSMKVSSSSLISSTPSLTHKISRTLRDYLLWLSCFSRLIVGSRVTLSVFWNYHHTFPGRTVRWSLVQHDFYSGSWFQTLTILEFLPT